MNSIVESFNLPKLAPLIQRHWWLVTEDWTYGNTTIPAGFVTDMDSIPRLPGIYLLVKGRSRIGALMHDYNYATGELSRKEADDLFLAMMLEEQVPTLVAKAMYRAVRLAGWRYYNKFQKLTPEERISRRMLDHSGWATCFSFPISKT